MQTSLLLPYIGSQICGKSDVAMTHQFFTYKQCIVVLEHMQAVAKFINRHGGFTLLWLVTVTSLDYGLELADSHHLLLYRVGQKAC